MSADERVRADGSAQGDKADLGRRAIAPPHVRAKSGDARGRRSASAGVDARFGRIGVDTGVGSHGAGGRVVYGAGGRVVYSAGPGGSSNDVQVVQESHDALVGLEAGGGRSEAGMLPEGEQGGGQGIPLLDPLSLVDIVALAGGVPPEVMRRSAVACPHERHEAGGNV